MSKNNVQCPFIIIGSYSDIGTSSVCQITWYHYYILKEFKNAQLPNFRFSNAHSFYILLYTLRTLCLSFFKQYLMLSNLVLQWFQWILKGDNSAFLQMWFKQIQSLFYCVWGSKGAELISLKFTVQFDHCPRFTLSFHSTILSLSLAFYKGSTLCSENRSGQNGWNFEI